MADSIRVTNMPDSGTHERVAYDLWQQLRHLLPDNTDRAADRKAQLAFYVQCRNATFGNAPTT